MPRYQKICVAAIFAIAIFFCLFHLTESPSFLFDEGWYFQTSANLATVGIDGIQMAPGYVSHISTFLTVGYPLIYPLALWFKIFGIGVLQARLLMAIVIMGFITAGYSLSRKLYGSAIGLAAFAMVATFPPLYGNGKSVMGEMTGLLLFALFLLCFSQIKADSGRKAFWIVLSGLCAGLSIATKPTFIVIIPAILIGVFIEWRRGNLSLKEIGIGAAGVVLPVLVWLFVQFRVTDSLHETLAYYANPYSLTSVSEVVIRNVKGLLRNMNPLYAVVLLGTWVVGLFLRLRSKLKIPSEEAIAFVFSALIFLAYLRTPGLYRYLFPAQLVPLVFFPYSLLLISQAIFGKIRVWKASLMFWIAIVILALLGIYQLGFNSFVAEAYSSHKTADLDGYFSNLDKNQSVFFYNVPDVVPFMRGRDYYQYIILFDRSLGSENLPVLRSGQVDKAVAQTAAFKENKGGIFDKYVEEKEIYKYSILIRRPNK